MRLLLILLLIVWYARAAATRGRVGSQYVEEDADVVDWSGREVGHLLTRFIHYPEIAERLKPLRGKWPFDAQTRCRSTKTRDIAFRKFAQRGRNFKLRAVPSCGINQLTGSRKHDRQLESQLDKFFDDEERRQNLHHSAPVSRDDKRIVGDRVVGGQEIVQGAWPWLAAVGSNSAGPRCGGSLIADRWVVTAAHCFSDLEMPCNYNVRLGSSNWLYDSEGNHVDVSVQAIYRHPDYNDTTMANDVALLKLREPVRVHQSGFVNAVCLPNKSQSLPVGTVCLAAGWGKLMENSSGSVLDAREVELPIITYDKRCGLYDDATLRPGMLCAGYAAGNHDTCQGDSGGPLTHIVDGRWTLIGLTSFGDGCARPGFPGIYTDVGYHLDWIAAVLARYG